MRRFDLKFGPELLATLPSEPGVYRFVDVHGDVVYVGKAGDLRRRLTQYRNAGTTRRGRKPHRIMKDAASLEWQVCPSELEASLEEIRLIQRLKPRHNVVGTFDFLYPFVGVAHRPTLGKKVELLLVLTSRPALFPELTFFGVYRSRETVALGVLALNRLFASVGHLDRVHTKKAWGGRDEYAIVTGSRQVPERLMPGLRSLLLGVSLELLPEVMMTLLESASATARAAEIQADIDQVAAFFKEECEPLKRAIEATRYEGYPVAQEDRDALFLRYRRTG
jgi:hypothetical protein